MVDAPEKIWIEHDDCPYFYEESELTEVGSPVTEYVRADLYAKLEAVVERMRKAVDDWLQFHPLVQHDLDNGYRQTPSYERPARELSGDTGELIDRMAAAIREDGGHYDDAPWESLSDERKEGWRGDARRALAVVKEYLTARRPEPASRTVTEAMVEALKRIRDTAMEHTLAARIPECGVFGGIAQDADWLLSEITAVMEAQG